MLRKGASDKTGRAVTLQDIADHCGVCRITASCALRGDRKNVGQKTMERIQAAAVKMGYDPAQAHAARRLKYNRFPGRVVNHIVAVFFPMGMLHLRYWAMIFEGLQEVLMAHQFGVLTCAVPQGDKLVGGHLPFLFHRGDVDGALIFPTDAYREEFVQELRLLSGFGDRPIVSLTESLAGCSDVRVDDRNVGFLAASHLLDCGHRELLSFRSRLDTAVTLERTAGHRAALEARGLDPDRHLHYAPWVWDDRRGLDIAMAEVLEQNRGVTAILCPSDGFGIPMARALRRLGHRVPEDLSLIGVDDCDEWMDSQDRNIWTSVRLPLRELGAEGARQLIRHIMGEEPLKRSICLPVELVVRGTTCPPADAVIG